MSFPFYIVGPTAVGKSEIAGEVAARCGAEVVNADAFQIYDGLPLLTAQPDAAALARAPHHLVGMLPLTAPMSAARFRELAMQAIADIRSRGKEVIVAGGSGLYVRALTDGFAPLPPADAPLRDRLEQLSLAELNTWLRRLDLSTTEKIDTANRRRVSRAVEICLLTNRPASELRELRPGTSSNVAGVFVYRDREELYQRINLRVEQMFADGVVDEVRRTAPTGATAEQTLGLRDIRRLLAGEMTTPECIAAIQLATRRYAKRQLTWFRRQTTFEPLNLTERTTGAAIEWIAQKARLSFAHD